MQGLSGMIDWTIKLGDLITIASFAAGIVAIFIKMGARIDKVDLKLDFIKEQFSIETDRQNEKIDRQAEEISKLGNLVVLVGRYEERMIALQEDVKELRHGRGFVIDKTIQLGGER